MKLGSATEVFFNLVCIHKVLLLLNRVQIIDFWGPCAKMGGGGGVSHLSFFHSRSRKALEKSFRGSVSSQLVFFFFFFF